jgi:hypothetical protein
VALQFQLANLLNKLYEPMHELAINVPAIIRAATFKLLIFIFDNVYKLIINHQISDCEDKQYQ